VEFLTAITDKELCDNCLRRRTTNPLRALDCKIPTCQAQYTNAPRMLDHLDDASRAHWDGVRAHLDDLEIPYTITPHLVRGLDYYTHTAFEITGGAGLGAQNTLAAGGRYNGLIELLGGAPTPAVGGALGIERVLLALTGESARAPHRPRVFFVVLDDAQHLIRPRAVGLAKALRRANVPVVMDDAGAKMKAQMKLADKIGATHALILGENEAKQGIIIVRDMTTSQQEEITLADAETTALQITRRVTAGYPNITD